MLPIPRIFVAVVVGILLCGGSCHATQSGVPTSPIARVLVPSPTPPTTVATVSPLPSPTPTPILEPAIVTADEDHLPTLTSDLFYVKDGVLYRWAHRTNEQQPLLPSPTRAAVGSATRRPIAFGPGSPPGTVMNVAMAHSGKQLAAIVAAGALATGSVSDIVLLDLATNLPVTLVQQSYNAQSITFSPDGNWLAYWADEEVEQARRPAGLAAPLPQIGGDGLPSAAIYAQRTTPPYQRIRLGSCTSAAQTCQTSLHWAADGEHLLWLGESAIWRADLQGNPPQSTPAELVTAPVFWSAEDNYLLGSMGSGYIEGSVWAIVNTVTGERMAIPDTFEYVLQHFALAWGAEEHLLIIRAGPPLLLQQMTVADETLAVVDELAIPAPLPTNPDRFPIKPSEPFQLIDGRILFALANANPQDPAGRGIYQIEERARTRLNGLPPAYDRQVDDTDFRFDGELFWAPDGSGAIYVDPYAEFGYAAETVLYVPTDGSALYDLKPILGHQPSKLLWVAP